MGGGTLRDTGRAPLAQKSSRDLNHHTKLKLRQPGQNAPSEVKVSREELAARLQEKEASSRSAKRKREGLADPADSAQDRPMAALPAPDAEEVKRQKLLDESNPDADDDVDEDDDDDGDMAKDDDDDDDDDEEDETAELLLELEKIKRERAEEKERLEKEKREEEERQKEEAMLSGNPLLNVGGGGKSGAVAVRDFSVKRRWDDDVVFKNQAKGQDEAPKKRFINDLLRSDFHRKFMSKYVR
ncbi:hypothetical protein HK101_005085 [Irineochytrium annulatum]|nr:hypothetical protein HK101_005085 [Irineochytrium annulatum]